MFALPLILSVAPTYVYIYIRIYTYGDTGYLIVTIDCALIVLDAHMLRHNGYGWAREPGPGPAPKERTGYIRLLGPWARVPRPGCRAHVHYG